MYREILHANSPEQDFVKDNTATVRQVIMLDYRIAAKSV